MFHKFHKYLFSFRFWLPLTLTSRSHQQPDRCVPSESWERVSSGSARVQRRARGAQRLRDARSPKREARHRAVSFQVRFLFILLSFPLFVFNFHLHVRFILLLLCNTFLLILLVYIVVGNSCVVFGRIPIHVHSEVGEYPQPDRQARDPWGSGGHIPFSGLEKVSEIAHFWLFS